VIFFAQAVQILRKPARSEIETASKADQFPAFYGTPEGVP